jgi:hypothetical protein
MSVILGINAMHAGAAAALIVEGRPVIALAEERLNRVKYYARFPGLAIQRCLAVAGLGWRDVDAVAVGRDASANRAQKLRYVVSHPTRLLNLMKIRGARSSLESLRDWIARECEVDPVRLRFFLWRSTRLPASGVVYVLTFALGDVAAVKPHFVAAIGVVELFHLRRREDRLGLWSCLTAGAVLRFALLALEPLSFEAMLTRMIPYYQGTSHDFYGRSFSYFASGRGGVLALAVAWLLLSSCVGAALSHRVPRRVSRVEPGQKVMLFSPGVENVFTGALARGIEILGPWSTHFMVPVLLAIEDPRERERALSSCIEPIAEKIRTQHPDAPRFPRTPQALGGTTLHDVFVTRHGVFPARG